MSSLPTPLRRQLESAVMQARKVAEDGARHALEALAVHEPDPYRHMDEAQRDLRRKLRAQAKQLGDGESQTKRGAYEIKHLAEKLAYDQWHRLLFARYLLENNLLISPEHGVAVGGMEDCQDYASILGLKDGWAVAASFAAKELPEIFLADDPAGAVELSVNDRKPLIELVTGLSVQVFTASDSLGWCYQFWQAEKKDEVNAAGNKIGADELPSVTQLFTEDYMVDFLLDNTLGAWHAGKVFAVKPKLAENAQSEDELRQAVALPGCPWKYLRFMRGEYDKWIPAAGTFDGWPKTARELKCLDPCMGSGHFVVAMFERLVALRIVEEGIEELEAVVAAIRENLFGLELDARCTQIGAFNLALSAWRRAGHCRLPPMNLACSGLAPNSKLDEWLKLAGDDERLQRGMARLYALFKNAPVLGSLINPRAAGNDLLEAEYHELQPLLDKAMALEINDDGAHAMAVTAQGLAKAAEILVGQFTLVATNVPYLGRGDQDAVLKRFLEREYPDSKTDLATAFVERALDQVSALGSIALVVPRIWLTFTAYYKVLREKLLLANQWNVLAPLGKRAFRTIGGEVVDVALLEVTKRFKQSNEFAFLSASAKGTPDLKQAALLDSIVATRSQEACLRNPGCVALVEGEIQENKGPRLLKEFVSVFEGISRGDTARFDRFFWELPEMELGRWLPLISSSITPGPYGGRSSIFLWEGGRGELSRSPSARVQGTDAWGKQGVFVSRTHLNAHLTSGAAHSQNGVAILPKDPKDLEAIWHFCSSENYRKALLALNQKLIKPTGVMDQVQFDAVAWRSKASTSGGGGLPRPFSSDPTQWLFNGHPKGSDQPLQVAVARLLGYRWPRQTGTGFPNCLPLGADGLERFASASGIVCLHATKGEVSAAEELRKILASAWGKGWSSKVLENLLARVGFTGKSIDDWLRNGFFEQHCALFRNRPYLWHVWDGHKSGFSALINCHRLTHASLERLTYAHLGDWIQRQRSSVEAGEAGSDARLSAAQKLQAQLKLILDGEPPYDLFVRWKPIAKQAICWNPDVQDGVRMNIRPFAMAGILRKRVQMSWARDKGTAIAESKSSFPWLWKWDGRKVDYSGSSKFDGFRWNDCHYTCEFKRNARKRK